MFFKKKIIKEPEPIVPDPDPLWKRMADLTDNGEESEDQWKELFKGQWVHDNGERLYFGEKAYKLFQELLLSNKMLRKELGEAVPSKSRNPTHG